MKKIAVSLLSAGLLFFGAPIHKAEAGAGLITHASISLGQGNHELVIIETVFGVSLVLAGVASNQFRLGFILIILDEEGKKVDELQLSDSEAEILKEAIENGATEKEVLELAEVLTADF